MTQMSRGVREAIRQHHSLPAGSGQCSSMQVQRVRAPLPAVWSIVRRFDRPHAYKCFLRSCSIRDGDGSLPGSVRDVGIATGLPAAASRERLDVLDDEAHIMAFSIIGGDHRLSNYRSTVTVHDDFVDEGEEEEGEGGAGSVVVESYVVDVPEGSTGQDTCVFADTIIRCNLQNLARIAENNNP